jgi:hypothetical protein
MASEEFPAKGIGAGPMPVVVVDVQGIHPLLSNWQLGLVSLSSPGSFTRGERFLSSCRSPPFVEDFEA